MEIISRVSDMMALGTNWRKEGKTVGLVPTMGFLHDGHLALAKTARLENDIVVMSIFVNPIQFGEGEDYEVYPRDLAHDAALAERINVDYIFNPTPAEMYGDNFHTTVKVDKLTLGLCGASRPIHFQGVTTVVNKLFNIVQPANAYFGQKDGQQVAVIEKMVADLNMPVNIVRVPIVREADGLALSSRNIYLSAEERKQALVLSQCVIMAVKMVEAGEKDVATIKKSVIEHINTAPIAKIEYVEIVDAKTMEPQQKITGVCMLAMAVRFGKTRLIDNVLLK